MVDTTAFATDLERAIAELRSGDHTCVLRRGEDTLTSQAPGVAALVDWIASGVDLAGFSAADRVVGRAAGWLYAYAGVVAVHAELASLPGLAVLADHGIPADASRTVPAILNRDRSGSCPMEAAVAGIGEPPDAVAALTEAVRRIRGGQL